MTPEKSDTPLTDALMAQEPHEGCTIHALDPWALHIDKLMQHARDLERKLAESAQAPNSDGVERPFIHAFSIKRGKEDGVWYLHGEELVPGLHLVGKNLADVLADLIPAWKRLYEVSPQQVPSPNEMDER